MESKIGDTKYCRDLTRDDEHSSSTISDYGKYFSESRNATFLDMVTQSYKFISNGSIGDARQIALNARNFYDGFRGVLTNAGEILLGELEIAIEAREDRT